MKKSLNVFLLLVMAMATLCACDDEETYAEQKEREHGYINNFINGNCGINQRAIKVISEADFQAQGETTDTAQNEYVLFGTTGVYMQIINKGTGANFAKLKDGESSDVLCRYTEYNINGDSLQSTNDNTYVMSTLCDKMTVINTSGTFSATFIYGMMPSVYGSTSVPSGWLVPLTYINLGRPTSDNDELAHVRIIIPHDQGHAYATSNVYACYYDITYEKGL